MSTSFDPYHQWLGIRDPQRPPNLYRLLGVDLFETSTDVIETAADRQMAHLRTFQNGPHAAVSQRLLNEVSAAKVCLLNVAKKADYDQRLQEQQPPKEPPVAVGELIDDNDMGVVVESAPVALRQPGRGPRTERPWYVSTTFLLSVLGVLLCVVAYRIYRDRRPNRSDSVASVAEIVPRPSDAADSTPTSETNERREPPGDAAEADVANTTDPESEAPATNIPSDMPTRKSPPETSEEESPAADTPKDATSVASSEPPDWNAKALIPTGQPAKFTTSQPMGAFLLALAGRDLTAAENVLQALRQNRALALPETKFQEAELVRDALTQFWHAVDTAQANLQPNATLTLGKVPVTFIQRSPDGATLQLEAPTGQRQSFELRRQSMHRDLAVALVDQHFAASPATGWRLIAIFLAIDRDGDVALAEHFAERAELRGFAARFLTQIIRRLSGDDASAAPPLSYSPASSTSPVVDAAPSEPPRAALPEKNELRQARRDVLAAAYAELRRDELKTERWPAELLRRAGAAELDEASRYVLLDSAFRRAKSKRDLETALAAIDELTSDFELSRSDMRYQLLQTLTRRLKGDDRRPYADLAAQFAREAVGVDDYEQAVRFASIAQVIARPISDRSLRKRLLNFRLEIDAIRNAYQALTADSKSDNASSPNNAKAARFRTLVKGDFESAMNGLSTVEDPALAALAQQELAKPDSADKQLALGQGWFRLSESVSGVEKVNALRRARHWYDASLPELNRSQRIDTRRDLDAISAVLGRDSDRLDLTQVPPVDVSVGYGTFGVNKNVDAASNPKVESPPQLAGHRVTRFLWACGPSRIEYLLPEGTTRFRAIGVINANSQNGASFVVKVDGKVLFASPPIKTMGSHVPIQVDLPGGAQTLELIVDPVGNNSLDHTYWVNPELTF